jgi:hypothetical protein
MKKETDIQKAKGLQFAVIIKNSQYLLLNDDIVARLLKPTIKAGSKYYNLRINGKIKQYSIEEIEKLTK